MAIVGLHSVPVIESSILRESQSSSSGRHDNHGSISTPASSILQMWRELEDECVVNRAGGRGRSRLHQESNEGLSSCQEGEGRGGLEDCSESENGSVINSESPTGPLNDQDDHQSMTSEQSQDFGEVERERVRKIFREWMNSGGIAQEPNVSHRNRGSRAQWLGETERERVRAVREWIQMTSQRREACVGNREDQVAEIGSQIEQARDGQVVDRNEGQAENSRRQIRRLCGRQALLDLLAKKEQERRQELQGLEVAQPVSRFAHRNRIQSLLRLRCFQNMRSAELSRPSSTAESELGLLRQRQTVSGLREGFLSRLDNNAHVEASELSNGPSANDAASFRDDQTLTNSANEDDFAHEENDPVNEVLVGFHEQNHPANEVCDGAHEQNEPEGDAGVGASAHLLTESSSGDTNSQHLEAQVEARMEHALDNSGENRPETANSGISNGSSDERNPQINSEEPSRSGNGEFSDLEETRETFCLYDSRREEINISNQLDDEIHVFEDVNVRESGIQVGDLQEQITEYDERGWEGSVLPNQWIDDDQEETDRQHWPGNGEELADNVLETEGGDQNDVQEDYWHESGSLETPRDWLGVPSSSAVPSARADAYYFSDDDNVYHMELRELVNRRRVSSLLQSDFRESLDQLVQSYVERQTHAPDDWEPHEMSPPPFAARDQEQLGTDHHEETGLESIHAEGSRRALPTPPPAPPLNWRHSLHHTNWSRHDVRQHPGTEWEIINDLRIDMARLQQRLNNMQRMLEACMDMQLELQRSVRQEVSAALNRSIKPSELVDNILPKGSLKWDCVRKGICCICSNTNIDSLLYRCGHMCTCTQCADLLVQGNGKCPMCQAPVIEVIRAYFIQ